MKEPLAKTKVVVRKLPPHLKEEVLKETIDSDFSGLYDWFAYYPGKTRCISIVPTFIVQVQP